VRTDAQTEAALLEILERFCSGFAARDADGVIQLFAPDADVVMGVRGIASSRSRRGEGVSSSLRAGDFQVLLDVGPP
jgi:hypothetical protein